jgi:hypothetical protein
MLFCNVSLPEFERRMGYKYLLSTPQASVYGDAEADDEMGSESLGRLAFTFAQCRVMFPMYKSTKRVQLKLTRYKP